MALPEGSFTITAQEHRRLEVALGLPGSDGDVAQPVFAYVATQRGIGVDIAGLFAEADFDVDDGPMLASSALDFQTELRVDVPYRVTGEIVGLERKSGNCTGEFDLFTVREALWDGDALVVDVTNVFVLPRMGPA